MLTGTSDSLTSALKERIDNPDLQWSLKAVSSGNQALQWVRDRWQEWISFEERGFIRYVRDAIRGVQAPDGYREAGRRFA